MRVAVLGAGIQGSCLALELAARGVDVDLYDRAPRCLTGASVNCEGKIHLGFVYAADPSLRTARRLVEGAFAFSRNMRRWIGDAIDALPRSRAIHYLIHRDSMVPRDKVEAYFAAIHDLHLEAVGDGADYFGKRFERPPLALPDPAEAGYDRDRTSAVYETEEVALHTRPVAEVLRARVQAEPRVRLRMQTTVKGVARNGRLQVSAERDGQALEESYDQVVNALWDGRIAVDATMGLEPRHPWLFRYKEFMWLERPEPAPTPSTTVVLGPFGDVIHYPDGVVLSWYPEGRRLVTDAVEPPGADELLARRDPALAKAAMMDGLAELMPGLETLRADALERAELRGGWIYARGATDIDDAASGLHERHAVGPQSFDGYHTVDTGKYTLAPLFAMQLADRIAPLN